MDGYGFEVLSKNTMETFSNDVFFQFLKNIFLYIWGLGFFFKTVLLDARKERLMQGHARRGEGTRVHEARLHGVDLLGRPALFVADPAPLRRRAARGHCASILAPRHRTVRPGVPHALRSCERVFRNPDGVVADDHRPGSRRCPCWFSNALLPTGWPHSSTVCGLGRSRELCHPGALLVTLSPRKPHTHREHNRVLLCFL
jgi:hypothetical protein